MSRCSFSYSNVVKCKTQLKRTTLIIIAHFPNHNFNITLVRANLLNGLVWEIVNMQCTNSVKICLALSTFHKHFPHRSPCLPNFSMLTNDRKRLNKNAYQKQFSFFFSK